MRILLQKITEVVHQVSGPGAALNARSELERTTASVMDVDRQLDRVRVASGRRAA
jgi:hypothetical protein